MTSKEDRTGEIVIYETNDGELKIDVQFSGDTVWLNQAQMAQLFSKAKSTINEHIKNIFDEGELNENVVVKNNESSTHPTQKSLFGNSELMAGRPTIYYNLDVIISVGYRVKSIQGTRFRQWATEHLREYLIKGFIINDEFLKNAGGGIYWKELLAKIRDIRTK